jgi:hypothetical protein
MLSSVFRYLGFFLYRTLAVIEISSVDFSIAPESQLAIGNVSDGKR